MAADPDQEKKNPPVVNSKIKTEDLKKDNDEDDDFRGTQNKQSAEDGILMIAYHL